MTRSLILPTWPAFSFQKTDTPRLREPSDRAGLKRTAGHSCIQFPVAPFLKPEPQLPGSLTNRTERLLPHFLFDGERYARLRLRIKRLLPAPEGHRNGASQHFEVVSHHTDNLFGQSQLDFEQSRDGPTNTTG